MELQLSRVDYTVVGITNKNCVRLLPSSVPNETQKVAVADSDGILQLFSVKKDDIQIHFKTLPGPPISSLKCAGTSGSANDKIFIAVGNEVRGYTKKGKLFMVFDSGMTENITSMFVLNNELFLCGSHIYNHFRDGKEVGSYLCGDRIVDVIAFSMVKTGRLTSLIACESRMIRVIEHARVIATMEVDNSPTVLHIYEDDQSKNVLFGTVDGRVGILEIESLQGFQRWLVTNEKNTNTIMCIDSYDMAGNGFKNLILGRQDGNIEIYHVNVHDEMDPTSLIFLENCNESITSLQSGIVAASGHNEVLAVTYSGRIFGLTSQVSDANFDGSTGSYVFSSDASSKITKLRSDIAELQSKVSKERERYQSSTVVNSFMEVSAIALIPVNSTFILERKTSTYNLIIETPTAIDNILIECNTIVHLLDVEKNTAIISFEDTKNDGQILATYRCQVNTNRIELKLQTIEGNSGLLQTYISPVLQPKCSRLLQFSLKPLSLHYRVNELDESDRKGEADFKSDNITTLCILKESLSIEVSKKKNKVNLKLNINDACINHVLKIIGPQLIEHQKYLKDKKLYEALNELELDTDEIQRHLSDRYKNLLARKDEFADLSKKVSGVFEQIYRSIITMYESYSKLKGLQPNKKKIGILQDTLENYNYDIVLNIFRPDSEKTNDSL